MLMYLAAAPEHLSQALRFTERIAHVAYRIGPDGRLARRNLLPRTRGGLLVLEIGRASCRERVWYLV